MTSDILRSILRRELFPGRRVARALEPFRGAWQCPNLIMVDNRPEFTSLAQDEGGESSRCVAGIHPPRLAC